MKNLAQFEHLVDGNYYYGSTDNYEYIFESAGKNKCGHSLRITTVNFENRGDAVLKNTSWVSESVWKFRELTTFEKLWIDTCIKENKYVPKDKIKLNTYSLW